MSEDLQSYDLTHPAHGEQTDAGDQGFDNFTAYNSFEYLSSLLGLNGGDMVEFYQDEIEDLIEQAKQSGKTDEEINDLFKLAFKTRMENNDIWGAGTVLNVHKLPIDFVLPIALPELLSSLDKDNIEDAKRVLTRVIYRCDSEMDLREVWDRVYKKIQDRFKEGNLKDAFSLMGFFDAETIRKYPGLRDEAMVAIKKVCDEKDAEQVPLIQNIIYYLNIAKDGREKEDIHDLGEQAVKIILESDDLISAGTTAEVMKVSPDFMSRDEIKPLIEKALLAEFDNKDNKNAHRLYEKLVVIIKITKINGSEYFSKPLFRDKVRGFLISLFASRSEIRESEKDKNDFGFEYEEIISTRFREVQENGEVYFVEYSGFHNPEVVEKLSSVLGILDEDIKFAFKESVIKYLHTGTRYLDLYFGIEYSKYLDEETCSDPEVRQAAKEGMLYHLSQNPRTESWDWSTVVMEFSKQTERFGISKEFLNSPEAKVAVLEGLKQNLEARVLEPLESCGEIFRIIRNLTGLFKFTNIIDTFY